MPNRNKTNDSSGKSTPKHKNQQHNDSNQWWYISNLERQDKWNEGDIKLNIRTPCVINLYVSFNVTWFGYSKYFSVLFYCQYYKNMSYVLEYPLPLYFYRVPDRENFFFLVFGLANGPLIWAMFVYRNAIVFHSTDKVTSSYIHYLPPLLSFG